MGIVATIVIGSTIGAVVLLVVVGVIRKKV